MASADTVYLDGNLSALGFGQSDWAANGIPMTRVNANSGPPPSYASADATLSYKYDLGSNWSNAEENADCGLGGQPEHERQRRHGQRHRGQLGGPGPCGDSGAVINVTVPADTPSGDYRWYNSRSLTPLFPFGYGLSYTSFSFSNLKITALPEGGAATVSATVTNTGSRPAPTWPSCT